ncbi:hypothetical protein FJZ17_03810 [Candidatus Pacearchaeota archaeon]|nr:hypothetical protein [Candidatus Pacearchaeota archaeon]
MTSKILLLGLFLVFIIPGVLGETAEECAPIGCLSNSTCFTFGDVLNISNNPYYCDFNGSFIQQKPINSFCSNDYECFSGACLSEKCLDLAMILEDYTSIYQNLTNFSAGPCDVAPGCLNSSNFSNAHLLGRLCAAPKLGFGCFECDEDYEWNGSSCNLLNCTSKPGCFNQSSFDNANKINRACSMDFSCFRCKSGYSWNSTSSKCEYIITDSGGDSFWSSTTVLSNSDILEGYENYLKSGWRWKIYFEGKYYYIGVRNISSGLVTLEVSSKTSFTTLKVDENKEFDLNGDGKLDINLFLKSISGDKANFLLIFSKEEPTIPNNPVIPVTPDNPIIDLDNEDENNDLLFWIIVSLLIILSIAVIIAIAVFVHKNGVRQEQNRNNRKYLD